MNKSLTSLQGPEHQVPQALSRCLAPFSLIESYWASSGYSLKDVLFSYNCISFDGERIDSTPGFARLVWVSCGSGRWGYLPFPFGGTIINSEYKTLLKIRGRWRVTLTTSGLQTLHRLYIYLFYAVRFRRRMSQFQCSIRLNLGRAFTVPLLNQAIQASVLVIMSQ